MSGSAGREEGEDIVHEVERNSSIRLSKEDTLVTQMNSRKSLLPLESRTGCMQELDPYTRG